MDGGFTGVGPDLNRGPVIMKQWGTESLPKQLNLDESVGLAAGIAVGRSSPDIAPETPRKQPGRRQDKSVTVSKKLRRSHT